MAMTVTLAGPYRILRIVVDPRQADCDQALMASICYELWHAIEVLRFCPSRAMTPSFISMLATGGERSRLFPEGPSKRPRQ